MMTTPLFHQNYVRPLHATSIRRTDQELLALSRQGNAEATHCLIGRYRHIIDSVARKMAGNQQDEADIASETYVRVFDMIESCRSANTFPGWIKKIAINVFLGSYRKHQNRHCISLDSIIDIVGDIHMPVIEEYRAETPQGRM